MEGPTVRIIPKTVKVKIDESTGDMAKTRVAAYCRVSTAEDDQLNSLETQKFEFEKKIKSNPNWEFVNLYYDEGITGTCLRKRKAFNKMIADAHAGLIDLILVKSISRFARNTVDFLRIVRGLKEIGVGIIFEKERFYSLDDKNETMLSIFAALAQDESRQISTNVTWGVRARMKAGTYLSYARSCLGYTYTKDKKLEIEPEGAETVRYIFNLFLSGYTYREIIKKLSELGRKNFKGDLNWTVGQINRILSNEKYSGDLLYQKTFTKDYLTHARVKNNGEVEQVVVENHHEKIIDKSIYDAVQTLRSIKTKEFDPMLDQSKSMALAGLVYCGCCGRMMRRIQYKQSDGTSRFILTCKKQDKNQKKYVKCKAIKTLDYDLVLQAVSKLVEHQYRNLDLSLLKESINQGIQAENALKDKQALLKKRDELVKKQEDLVSEQIKNNIPIESFKNKYELFRRDIERIDKDIVSIEMNMLKNVQNVIFNKDLMAFLQNSSQLTPKIISSSIKRIYRLKDNSILIVPNKEKFVDFDLESLKKISSKINLLKPNYLDKDGRVLEYRVLD